MHKIQTNQQTY